MSSAAELFNLKNINNAQYFSGTDNYFKREVQLPARAAIHRYLVDQIPVVIARGRDETVEANDDTRSVGLHRWVGLTIAAFLVIVLESFCGR